MVTKGSVRRKSKDLFQKVVKLRKKGFSYTEIRKKTGIAKSTINNWLTFAGLTLTKEHLEIQLNKRVANHIIATKASRIIRSRKKDNDIQNFILENRSYFNDPLFVAGVMLYEAEGSKGSSNGFSNSDFRLIKLFLNFLKKYFKSDSTTNISYRLYIHELRKIDLQKILNFWSKKIGVNQNQIKISWKHNKVTKRRENSDYVGQFEVRARGFHYFSSKLLALSDIILSEHTRY